MTFDASALQIHVEARILEIEIELSSRTAALTDELARLRRALSVFLDASTPAAGRAVGPEDGASPGARAEADGGAGAGAGAGSGACLWTTFTCAAAPPTRPAPRHRAACQGSGGRRR